MRSRQAGRSVVPSDGAPLGGARSTTLEPEAPLAGVSSMAITAAARRVARRWRDQASAGAAGLPASYNEQVEGLVAALALAVDQQRPEYVTQLLPRPDARLGCRLVEMLQTELLATWSDADPPPTPAANSTPLSVRTTTTKPAQQTTGNSSPDTASAGSRVSTQYGPGVHRDCDASYGCGPWVSNANPNQIQQPPDDWVQGQRQ